MKVASKENTPAVNAESADELFAVHTPFTSVYPVAQEQTPLEKIALVALHLQPAWVESTVEFAGHERHEVEPTVEYLPEAQAKHSAV